MLRNITMAVTKLHVVLINVLLINIVIASYNGSEVGVHSDENGNSQILSRRKRFIIFPEGSSFQIGGLWAMEMDLLLLSSVFCNTFPTIFAIGDIFLFGYTAALAYELPQDPYSPFRHHGDPLHRRMDGKDKKMIYFTDFDGKILFKKKYERKPIVNPAFAKRSVDADALKKGADNFRIDRKGMHASQEKREFLKSEGSVEFHRSGRAALYPKIETVLQAVGRNGKHCVLRTLCQVGQTPQHEQDSFLHEILRAVFTLPKGGYDEELQEYDQAHSTTESCATLYPDCDDPENYQLPTFKI